MTTNGTDQESQLINFDASRIAELEDKLNLYLNQFGYEAAAFMIGDYNASVEPHFQLSYDPNTLAFSLLSNHNMFEKALLPLFPSMTSTEQEQPVNSTTKYVVTKAINTVILPFQQPSSPYSNSSVHSPTTSNQREIEVETLFDFDFVGRRPKVIVQVAGHVSGQAYYYQRKDVLDPEWTREGAEEGSHVYGCSVHPKYGGWFGFRGVILLKNVVFLPGEREGEKTTTEEGKKTVKEWRKKTATDVIPSQEDRKRLLSYFNNWDVRFRDVVPVKPEHRYSPTFEKFFETPPDERRPIIETAINELGITPFPS